jgi:hypothetical protein
VGLCSPGWPLVLSNVIDSTSSLMASFLGSSGLDSSGLGSAGLGSSALGSAGFESWGFCSAGFVSASAFVTLIMGASARIGTSRGVTGTAGVLSSRGVAGTDVLPSRGVAGTERGVLGSEMGACRKLKFPALMDANRLSTTPPPISPPFGAPFPLIGVSFACVMCLFLSFSLLSQCPTLPWQHVQLPWPCSLSLFGTP